ncbi:MAG: class I SAM-dependent methyltransferase [Maricaulaceae bacterium]
MRHDKGVVITDVDPEAGFEAMQMYAAHTRFADADFALVRDLAKALERVRAGDWPETETQRVLNRCLRAAGGGLRLDVPPQYRRGGLRYYPDQLRASVLWLLDLLAEFAEASDLSDKTILDIGCGVKFSQAFVENNIPVGHYHGVELDPGLVEFLSTTLRVLPYLSYAHIDVQNDMYNKDAPRLNEAIDLGAGGRKFDIVCLYSVFSHLDPTDYQTMLRLTRRHVAEDGRLVFSSFIRDQEPEFVDLDPASPLHKACYRRDVVDRWIEAAGWRLVRHRAADKEYYGQDLFVCAPA